MKEYKVNIANKVNSMASKNGMKWRYRGKTEDWKETVKDYNEHKSSLSVGIRITDCETNKIVYEQID